MSKFSEDEVKAAVRLLEAHRRHCEMHYDDTLMKISMATEIYDDDKVMELIDSDEVQKELHA